jgi:hypothetical protein
MQAARTSQRVVPSPRRRQAADVRRRWKLLDVGCLKTVGSWVSESRLSESRVGSWVSDSRLKAGNRGNRDPESV